MDWRITLVLIVAGLILIGIVILSIALAMERRRAVLAEKSAEKWRSRYQETADITTRLMSIANIEELTDEHAIKKLRDSIASWSPIDPTGAGESE